MVGSLFDFLYDDAVVNKPRLFNSNRRIAQSGYTYYLRSGALMNNATTATWNRFITPALIGDNYAFSPFRTKANYTFDHNSTGIYLIYDQPATFGVEIISCLYSL